MIPLKTLEELSQQLIKLMPESAKGVSQELQKNIQTVLQHSLSRLNLVTREEFESQERVLARALEQLAQLEQQVQQLEEKSGIQQAAQTDNTKPASDNA